MNQFSLELSLLAMLPGIFLCVYVFYKDRIEREPLGLLALLFGAGAIIYVPSYFLQELIIQGIDKAFLETMHFSAEGALTFSSYGAELAHRSFCAFVGFSFVQICLKWCALFFITHKNKNFNYLFDGVVYAVFLSVGFAVAENVHFVLQNDWELLVAKLLTSIPCHLFIGILMGYYYTMWHVRFVANKVERDMLHKGIIKQDNVKSSAVWLVSGFLFPFLLSGLYFLASSMFEKWITFLFYAAVFILYGISFLVIHHMADKDCSSKRYLCRLLAKGHPELSQETLEQIVKGEDAV